MEFDLKIRQRKLPFSRIFRNKDATSNPRFIKINLKLKMLLD